MSEWRVELLQRTFTEYNTDLLSLIQRDTLNVSLDHVRGVLRGIYSEKLHSTFAKAAGLMGAAAAVT
jgi:hypothetical protein